MLEVNLESYLDPHWSALDASKRLERCRILAGWSGRALSIRAGISSAHLRDLEQGRYPLSTSSVVHFALQVLELELDDLYSNMPPRLRVVFA